jgi:hypothetical protein
VEEVAASAAAPEAVAEPVVIEGSDRHGWTVQSPPHPYVAP